MSVSALLTDLYQLTMAYGYWYHGRAEEEAVFHAFFRRHPFGGGCTIATGAEPLRDFLAGFAFDDDDLAWLAELEGDDGSPMFPREFVDALALLRITCEVAALPEGTPVFPQEPMVRVRGPLWQTQLLETAILTIVNFASLVATKSARICRAARGKPVLEFGLRRAQGVDGGLSASRAAYVGGCAATSNVLAGRRYGIPVKGTHAHSWVMCHDDERASFERWAEAMPGNCVFLVDTYDTVEGVRRAIAVGERLRERGHEMVGIRLDSGDLGALAKRSRALFDEAGFPDAQIVASGDLDEHLIDDLENDGAPIDVYGVGTKLAAAFDEPALGGVYKIGAIRTGRTWSYRLKLSEEPIKVSNPGILDVRRFTVDGRHVGDAIWDHARAPEPGDAVVDPADPERTWRLPAEAEHRDLLRTIWNAGGPVGEREDCATARERTLREIERLDPAQLALTDPEAYPVGLEAELAATKLRLMREVGAGVGAGT